MVAMIGGARRACKESRKRANDRRSSRTAALGQVETTAAAHAVDSKQIIVQGHEYPFLVFSTGHEFVEVRNREHRKASAGIQAANRRCQRIGRIVITIVGDKNQLVRLAALPDFEIRRFWIEADILKTVKRQAEFLPE